MLLERLLQLNAAWHLCSACWIVPVKFKDIDYTEQNKVIYFIKSSSEHLD